MKRYSIYILLSVVMVWLASMLMGCKPYEERVIDRLNKLSEKIEKYGAGWDADQWTDALEELEDIHYEMEDCDFTPAQQKELGRTEGRLMAIIINEGSKKLGEEMTSFMDGAGAFLKGYVEGMESAMSTGSHTP